MIHSYTNMNIYTYDTFIYKYEWHHDIHIWYIHIWYIHIWYIHIPGINDAFIHTCSSARVLTHAHIHIWYIHSYLLERARVDPSLGSIALHECIWETHVTYERHDSCYVTYERHSCYIWEAWLSLGSIALHECIWETSLMLHVRGMANVMLHMRDITHVTYERHDSCCMNYDTSLGSMALRDNACSHT
jgi:hypothetical protein